MGQVQFHIVQMNVQCSPPIPAKETIRERGDPRLPCLCMRGNQAISMPHWHGSRRERMARRGRRPLAGDARLFPSALHGHFQLLIPIDIGAWLFICTKMVQYGKH